MSESPFFRVEEIATYAKVHKSVIYAACAQRKLEHIRVGGRRTILLRREWIDAFMESLRVHVVAQR